MDEFELIRALWRNPDEPRSDVILGIGDDAAIVSLPSQSELVITMDACIEGVHFFKDSTPTVIARRAFMRAFSDLAAMGAKPAWYTLSITTPTPDFTWFSALRDEFQLLANQMSVQLIGGDMSQGPLALHLTAFGHIPTGARLLRSTAKVGDLIVVSGVLGGANAYLKDQNNEFQSYYNAPNARVQLGQDLLTIANACIDISDGLTQDLNHILTASHVGATLQLSAIPIAPNAQLQNALYGGDDYELCFTIAKDYASQLLKLAEKNELPLSIIGTIDVTPGLRAVDATGQKREIAINGYRHYREK